MNNELTGESFRHEDLQKMVDLRDARIRALEKIIRKMSLAAMDEDWAAFDAALHKAQINYPTKGEDCD